MCYPKPGPRCSSHAKKTLARADKRLQEEEQKSPRDPKKYQEARRAYRDAVTDYKSTPDYIEKCKNKGDWREAAEQETAREAQIDAYKKLQAAPHYERFDTAENLSMESKDENGRVHSFHDQPSIAVNMSDGRSLYMWHKHGTQYRADGPAMILKKKDGSEVRTYFNNKGDEVSPYENPKHQLYENLARTQEQLKANGETPLTPATLKEMSYRYEVEDKGFGQANGDVQSTIDRAYDDYIAEQKYEPEDADMAADAFINDRGAVLNGDRDDELASWTADESFYSVHERESFYSDYERSRETAGFYE